jgi:hypothetical protein
MLAYYEIIVSSLKEKQQCVFKQFIAINDNLEVDDRVFISNNQDEEESKTAERQRERVCVCERERQCVAKSEG